MATKHYVRKEIADYASLPVTGEDNVLYELQDTGDLYRWDNINNIYVLWSNLWENISDDVTPTTSKNVLVPENKALKFAQSNPASTNNGGIVGAGWLMYIPDKEFIFTSDYGYNGGNVRSFNLTGTFLDIFNGFNQPIFGPYALSYNPTLDRLYVGTYQDGVCAYIDLNGYPPTYSATVVYNTAVYTGVTDVMEYNPVDNKVYAYDYNNDVILIFNDDLSTLLGTITPTVTAGTWGGGWYLAINTDNGDIWAVDNLGQVVAYDTSGTQVVDYVPPVLSTEYETLAYDSANDRMIISGSTANELFIWTASTRTLLTQINLTTELGFSPTFILRITVSEEVLIVVRDFLFVPHVIKLDAGNNVTEITSTFDDNNASFFSIVSIIKVKGQYAYIEGDNLYYTQNGLTNEVKPLIELSPGATSDYIHLLQNKSGTIAHLDDIPPPQTFDVNVSSVAYVDVTYGNDFTGQIDILNKPFSTLAAAQQAFINAGKTVCNIYMQPGVYFNTDLSLSNTFTKIHIHAPLGVEFSGFARFRDNGANISNFIFTGEAIFTGYTFNAYVFDFGGAETNANIEFKYINKTGVLAGLIRAYSIAGYVAIPTPRNIIIKFDYAIHEDTQPSYFSYTFVRDSNTNFDITFDYIDLNFSGSISGKPFDFRTFGIFAGQTKITTHINGNIIRVKGNAHIMNIATITEDSLCNYNVKSTFVENVGTEVSTGALVFTQANCGTLIINGDVYLGGTSALTQNGAINSFANLGPSTYLCKIIMNGNIINNTGVTKAWAIYHSDTNLQLEFNGNIIGNFEDAILMTNSGKLFIEGDIENLEATKKGINISDTNVLVCNNTKIKTSGGDSISAPTGNNTVYLSNTLANQATVNVTNQITNGPVFNVEPNLLLPAKINPVYTN